MRLTTVIQNHKKNQQSFQQAVLKSRVYSFSTVCFQPSVAASAPLWHTSRAETFLSLTISSEAAGFSRYNLREERGEGDSYSRMYENMYQRTVMITKHQICRSNGPADQASES